MGFGFKQPLVGEKRCVTTLITAAEETRVHPVRLLYLPHRNTEIQSIHNLLTTPKRCNTIVAIGTLRE